MIQLRLWTGLIGGVYVTLHLTNHALGLISVNAQETARPYFMTFWHSWPGQLLLYGSLTVHAVLGLYALVRRRSYRIPRWEYGQILLGLSIPYLLLVHIVNTRGTRILTRIDIDYVYEITNLWVIPSVRYRQIALVLLVWAHFVMGLHFWLRIKPWYGRAPPLLILFYVIVPVGGLLGFAEVGMTMTARSQVDAKWFKEVSGRGKPRDPARADLRNNLKTWVGPGWLSIVGSAFLIGLGRNRIDRGRRFAVTYPEGPPVSATVGMSILEASRKGHRPHMAVCGGRARCTTCRVRIVHTDRSLPPPNAAEAAALDRIHAPPDLRLACQTCPEADLAVRSLIHPKLERGIRPAANSTEFGEERTVTVLFLDVRGSSGISENRMPYDVVFVMNHFFAEMAGAVEAAGGIYSNFTGDGLMALFGSGVPPVLGARGALACAADILHRMDGINQRLQGELAEPLRVGIGIHTGEAIVGRMGPPRTPLMTALGDTVNAAARVESLCKEMDAAVVVSVDTLNAAYYPVSGTARSVTLRGRAAPLAVVPLRRAELLQTIGRSTGPAAAS
jgi:adenylate cyclase